MRRTIGQTALAAAKPLRQPIHLARPLINIPDGPSCSRWLSCTCCRKETIKPLRPIIPKRNHTLPLPPPLPYSPDSQPFLRHLQILSLSIISSSPEESWKIYLGVHTSLRRYIPDSTFRSLINHQLQESGIAQKWARVSSLLKVARESRMETSEIGKENIEGALGSALGCYLFHKPSKTDEIEGMIKWLWGNLKEMYNGDLSAIPHRIRYRWLLYRYKKGRSVGKRNKGFLAMEELLAGGGGDRLDALCGAIVSSYGQDEGTRTECLAMIGWSWNHGVKISEKVTTEIMERISRHMSRSAWEDHINGHIKEYQGQGAVELSEHLGECFVKARNLIRSSSEKATDILGDGSADTRHVREGIRLIKSIGKSNNLEDLRVYLELIDKILGSDTDAEIIIDYSIRILCKLQSAIPKKELDALILRFLQSIVKSNRFLAVRSSTLHDLFFLSTTILPSEEAYGLCLRMYPHARESLTWTHETVSLWQALFRHATSPRTRHLHFASRLYADLRADNIPVRRTDALAMIRCIGMSPSPSRNILLERHLKDYEYMRYGHLDQLVTSLVEGLSSTRNPEAALLGIHLSKRILGDRPVPIKAAQCAIQVLAASSLDEHQSATSELLSLIPKTQLYAPTFENILHGFVRQKQSLSRIAALYKELVSAKISISPRMTSLILRSLVQSNNLESAVPAFKSASKAGIVVNSNVVGRLMIGLANSGRLDEAEEVERLWRDVAAGQWDLGVIGARVYINYKRGKKVDLQEVQKKTGWKPNSSFGRFLEKARLENLVHIKEVQTMGKPAEDVVKDNAIPSKPRIRPLTRSLWDGKGEGEKVGWWEDKKGVDMMGVGVVGL